MKRLLVVIVLVVIAIVSIRGRFIPDTFGDKGHYRAAAVDSIMALEINYAGHEACFDCHDDIEAIKIESSHKTVNCETCHGPAQEHVEDPGEVNPILPRERKYCALCHDYNPARPTGFPQIDPERHNPGKQCVICHSPHAPEPPTMTGECNVCHTSISRTKALSLHAPLECTQCHVVPDEHKLNPRTNRAKKPQNNAVCGRCHDKKADSDKFIPKVDVQSHNENYPCWQCHYPHYPEAS